MKIMETEMIVYAEDLLAEEKILGELGWELDEVNCLNGLEATLLKNMIQLHKRIRTLEHQLWEVRRGNSRGG